jgi:hypothetical protein
LAKGIRTTRNDRAGRQSAGTARALLRIQQPLDRREGWRGMDDQGCQAKSLASVGYSRNPTEYSRAWHRSCWVSDSDTTFGVFMNVAPITPIHSASIQELNELFNNLQKPYGRGEIVRFNLAYQKLYPNLSRHEKRRAEALVDALLVNLEDERLASKIYGVV